MNNREKFILYKLNENEKLGNELIIKESYAFIEDIKQIYILCNDEIVKKYSIKCIESISKYEVKVCLGDKGNINDNDCRDEIKLLSLGLKCGQNICSDYCGSMSIDEFCTYLYKVHKIDYKDANGIALKLLCKDNYENTKYDIQLSFDIKGLLLRSVIVGTIITKVVFNIYRTGCISFDDYLDIMTIIFTTIETIKNYRDKNEDRREMDELTSKVLSLENELSKYKMSIVSLKKNYKEIIDMIKDKCKMRY